MISQVKLMLLVVGAAFGDGSKVPELSGIKVVAPISQLERLKKSIWRDGEKEIDR